MWFAINGFPFAEYLYSISTTNSITSIFITCIKHISIMTWRILPHYKSILITEESRAHCYIFCEMVVISPLTIMAIVFFNFC